MALAFGSQALSTPGRSASASHEAAASGARALGVPLNWGGDKDSGGESQGKDGSPKTQSRRHRKDSGTKPSFRSPSPGLASH